MSLVLPNDDLNRFPSRLIDEPILSEYQNMMTDLARRGGLIVNVDYDMEAFCRFLRQAPGNDGVSPVFNPDRVELDDAFWVRVENHAGEIVGTNAQRLIRCQDRGYYDLVRDGTLFGAEPAPPLTLLFDHAGPTASCSHSGGIYVRPDVRGSGLSWFLPHFGRAVAIRLWNVKTVFGMVFESLRKTGIAQSNYGAQRVLPMYSGSFPLKGPDAILSTVESDVDWLLQGIRNTLLQLSNSANKEMSDFAPMSRRERKH